MRIWAWIVFGENILGVFLGLFVFGKPRRRYGVANWVGSILGVFLMGPLCGRVLGWW